jgi:hypothetical protein
MKEVVRVKSAQKFINILTMVLLVSSFQSVNDELNHQELDKLKEGLSEKYLPRNDGDLDITLNQKKKN